MKREMKKAAPKKPAKHMDAKEDKKLVKSMVKKDCRK